MRNLPPPAMCLQPMDRSLSGFLKAGIFSIGLLLAPLPCLAIALRVEQIGNDVWVFGSGSANTTELTLESRVANFTNVLTEVQAYAGKASNNDGQVSLWSGVTGPLALNNGISFVALPVDGSSTGDLFGIVTDTGTGSGLLVLPYGYSSGAILSGISHFEGYTLADFGLSPGVTLDWKWGTGSNADILELQVAGTEMQTVPTPLPVAGAVLAWRTSRRLRQKTRKDDHPLPSLSGSS